MCRSLSVVLLTIVLFGVTAPVQADPHGHSYPKVRTFSGGYYGPTQAHYQYERRYGHPWHGQSGLYAGHGHHHGYGYHQTYPVGPGFGYGGYGAVLGGWAAPSFGVYGFSSPFGLGVTTYGGYPFTSGYYSGYPYSGGWNGIYPSPPPVVNSLSSPTPPQFLSPLAPGNPVLNDAWQENVQQWEQPIDALPVISNKRPKLPPSSPESQARSVHFQHEGDLLLKELKYPDAARKYRDAISAAADRAEPHFHLAIAFAGMRRFDEAVHELKVGLSLDPTWSESGTTLDTLLHPDNVIAKSQLKQAIAEWTLRDVRNPDRLFLLGVVLYLDNDAEKAREILETAARLSGMQDYLAVFLRSENGVAPNLSPVPAQVPDPVTDEVTTVPPSPVEVAPAPQEPVVQPLLPALPGLPPVTGTQGAEESSEPSPEINGPTFPQ